MRKKGIQFLGFDGRRRMDSATYVRYVRHGGSIGEARGRLIIWSRKKYGENCERELGRSELNTEETRLPM